MLFQNIDKYVNNMWTRILEAFTRMRAQKHSTTMNQKHGALKTWSREIGQGRDENSVHAYDY